MKRTLIVDPRPSGHRAFYLALIADALGPEAVVLMVPPGDAHLAATFARRGLVLRDFAICEPGEDLRSVAVVAQAAEAAATLGCGRILFAYLDEVLGEVADFFGRFPCPAGGIWFHSYALDRRYRWLPPLDKRLRLRGRVHRALRRVRASQAGPLLFLDPGAVGALARVNPALRAGLLPDPWERKPVLDQAGARRKFSLPGDRMIFLHIGSSESRKGLADVIDAFRMLAADPSWRDRVLLLRVGENGRLKAADRAALVDLTESGMARMVDGFVAEEDFIEYFAAADWVLLPYRGFRHSSGILSNALAAERPVIASDYGLVARTVRERNCGVLFRHKSRPDLVRVIRMAAAGGGVPAGRADAEGLSPACFIAALREALADPQAS